MIVANFQKQGRVSETLDCFGLSVYLVTLPQLFSVVSIIFIYLSYLAIDETDRMGEKGHFIGLGSILEAVGRGQTHKQRFVMSATLSLVHKAPVYKKGEKNRYRK